MLDENNMIENGVLSTLERLGFPMHDEGTLFYKDVILNASKSVFDIFNGDSNDNFFMILKKLEETNSSFYKKVADNNNIGEKEFHSKINNALSNINSDNMDKELFKEIFCTKPNTFGEQVFYFALYSLGFSFKKEEEETLKLEYV